MITKERLEELIKKRATIYYITICNDGIKERFEICDIDLFLKCTIIENYTFSDGFKADVLRICYTYYPLKELYETKKQAKWALKYHATRTEELELPMWEELDGADFDMSFIDTRKIKHQIWVTNDDGICVTNPQLDDENKYWSYSKENYIEACNYCLKLFKGEEK